MRRQQALSREQRHALRAIAVCRTPALGGHVDVCTRCGFERPAYHPKCQSLAQAVSRPLHPPRRALESTARRRHGRRRDVSHQGRSHGHAPSRGIPPPASPACPPVRLRQNPPQRSLRFTPGVAIIADGAATPRASAAGRTSRTRIDLDSALPAPDRHRPHPLPPLRAIAPRPPRALPLRRTTPTVIDLVRSRTDRIVDGANVTLPRAAGVCPLAVHASTTDPIERPVRQPPTRVARRGPSLTRSSTLARATGTPPARLPRRIVSP